MMNDDPKEFERVFLEFEHDLDAAGTSQLTVAFMKEVRAYYKRMPTHRARMYEVLNALAFVVATTLEATDGDQARRWFADCLDQQEADIAAAQEQGHA
jgi:hypothetical protein